MKLRVINANEGVLWVDKFYSSSEGPVPFDVDLKNILKWYPFSFLYYYEEKGGEAVLRRNKRAKYPVYGDVKGITLDSWKKGMDKGSRGIRSYLHIPPFNPVYNRNKEMVNFAHHLGVYAVSDVYDTKSLEHSFYTVSRWQDKIKTDVYHRSDLYDPLTSSPSGVFGLEESDGKIFSLFSEEELYNFRLSGEVYAMLVVMGKILKAKEANYEKRIY